MEGIRDAILRMVKAGLETKKLQEAYANAGLDDNALFQIFSEISSAIYDLIGEQTETFEESKTNTLMNAPCISVEKRAELLYNEYVRNNSCTIQSKPITVTTEQMKEMYRKSGGYLRETPEGDWS